MENETNPPTEEQPSTVTPGSVTGPQAHPHGTNSGAPIQPSTQTTQKTPPLAIVGLILVFIFPIAGLVVSIIALKDINKRRLPGKNLAITGIILNASFIFLSIVGLLLLYAIIYSIGDG